MKQRKLNWDEHGPAGRAAAAVVNALSAMWLACALLACMMVLTWAGTWSQETLGLHGAIQVYFKSFFLYADTTAAAGVPFWEPLVNGLASVGLTRIPIFPGGYVCMGLLAINMFLGGFLRMPVKLVDIVAVAIAFLLVLVWGAGLLPFLAIVVGELVLVGVLIARSELRSIQGVVLTHMGIAFLLFAAMIKTASADEGKISLYEGQAAGYFDSYYKWEVAVWDLDAPMTGSEVVIDDSLIRDLDGDDTRTFTHADLPFELVLSNFVSNCRVAEKGPMWESAGPPINGWGILEVPNNKEGEYDRAGLHASVKTDEGEQKAILWGAQFAPWTVEVAGKRWAVDMRHERYPMPFAIRLDDFIKDDHPGMSMARAFKSHVTRIDGDGEQPVLIQMNEPLRDGPLVLFQSSFNQAGGRELSVFSVVRNVSDKWPEYAMWVTTFGMLWVFLIKLTEFVRRQTKRAAQAARGA